MPSVAVQTSWSWVEDIAKIVKYYGKAKLDDVTLDLSVPAEVAEQLNEGVSSVSSGRGVL